MLKLNLTKIKALIIKEIIVLLKDPKSRFALMMPPIIQLILFSSVATLDVFNIKLGVINYDNGSYSREIVQDIAASKEYFTKISYFDNYSEIKENIDKQKFKPCLEYHLGNCLAPCAALQTEDDYLDSLEQLKNMLKGNMSQLMGHLKKQMQAHAEDLDF